jgi:hypothetical protein
VQQPKRDPAKKGTRVLLLSQPFDSARLMLLCCLLKRCLDLGFHFSGFLGKRPTRIFDVASRCTIGGPANIAKLPELVKRS